MSIPQYLRDEIRTRLRQPARIASTLARATKWQPIETAPTDGKPVLLWRPYHLITQAFAYPESWKDFPVTDPRWFWRIYRHPRGDKAGSCVPFEPTHWHPLPDPPES